MRKLTRNPKIEKMEMFRARKLERKRETKKWKLLSREGS
jgi:hypothetical protein